MSFAVVFPVPARQVTVDLGGGRVVAWVARRDGERYAAVVEPAAVGRLSSLQRRRLLAELARRAGGGLVSGWFAYAPLQDACGPPERHDSLVGHRATARFVGPVRPLHGAEEGCLGTLVVRLSGAQLSTMALGPAGAVRSFIDSVALR